MISKVKRKAEISCATDKLKSGLGASFVRVVENPKKIRSHTHKRCGFGSTRKFHYKISKLRDDTNCIAIAQLSVFLIYFGSTKGL